MSRQADEQTSTTAATAARLGFIEAMIHEGSLWGFASLCYYWNVGRDVKVIESPAGVVFAVRVIPRARKTGVAGTREGALVVRLAASPVDGAANAALIAYLGTLLDRPKREITIVAGQTSREKRIAVSGMTAAQLTVTLSDILPA